MQEKKKTHKDSHCVEVTASKSYYLIFISKEYSILGKQNKNLIPKSIVS